MFIFTIFIEFIYPIIESFYDIFQANIIFQLFSIILSYLSNIIEPKALIFKSVQLIELKYQI